MSDRVKTPRVATLLQHLEVYVTQDPAKAHKHAVDKKWIHHLYGRWHLTTLGAMVLKGYLEREREAREAEIKRRAKAAEKKRRILDR